MKKLLSFIFLICFITINPAFAKIDMVKCLNGIFIGKKEKNTDVIAFKGIPYAKKPTGKLRWKAPILAPNSHKIQTAFKYDTMALQTDSETDYEHFKKSEDCLRLNIWTHDLKTKNKPVMVYFHGGAYGFEGAAMSIYDGQYLVNTYKDIIFVSVDYRVNLMGFIDFSDVEGGENFKDAPYLGILDCITALKWVNQNIEAFGGDPHNITIFGESAGGGIVSIMMVVKEAEGLFQKVIAQSGTLNLTNTLKNFKEKGQTKEFMKATNTKNMNELMKLSDKQILNAMAQDTIKVGDEAAGGVGNLNNFPLKGSNSIIPENPYKILEGGMSKNIDLMIGTNKDEFRYWIVLMGQPTIDENMAKFDKFMENKAQIKDKNIQNKYLSIIKTDEDKYSAKHKNIWKNTELANDLWFRIPSIKTAEAHIKSNGTGKTYFYHFKKECDNYPWWKSAHAAELPYIFNNSGYKEYGNVDAELAKHLSNAWVNFARTGNPSTDFAKWSEYDLTNRNTMVIENDNSMKMIKDYKGEQRKLLNNLEF